VPVYGTPDLGNYRDPVKEIYYILLSAKTTEGLYRAAYGRLWRRFPSLADIAGATVTQIQCCIQGAGLGAKRARQAKQIAQRLLGDFGPRPQRRLRRMHSAEMYRYLVSLPGIGPKSALCVLMYCFDADVFPVDANIQRILSRMGAIHLGRKHYQAQQYLPAYVPQGLSKSLHIVLVIHGRTVCRPKSPKCVRCHIGHLCKTGRRARNRSAISEFDRKSGIVDSVARSS
jgi:endonuclease III